jgi:hypothetical protein
MPFITSENSCTVQTRTEDQDSILEGLNILRDLVGHVALPSSHRQELLALSALESLLSNRECSDSVALCRDDLLKEVELLSREDIITLVHWICPTGGLRQLLSQCYKRRCQRRLHLFVLLARVIAPVSRYVVIPVLSELGLCPDRVDCYRTLKWVPKWSRHDDLILARHYLELTRKVWFDESSRPVGGRIQDRIVEFSGWPWQQQVLELLAWRAAWNAEQNDGFVGQRVNPAIVSGTIEFGLAREQLYGQLRRTGGRLARAVLQDMGYRDLSATGLRGHFLSVAVSMLILALSAVLVIHGVHKAKSWNQSNHKLATLVNSKAADASIVLPHPNGSDGKGWVDGFDSICPTFHLNWVDSLRGQ